MRHHQIFTITVISAALFGCATETPRTKEERVPKKERVEPVPAPPPPPVSIPVPPAPPVATSIIHIFAIGGSNEIQLVTTRHVTLIPPPKEVGGSVFYGRTTLMPDGELFKAEMKNNTFIVRLRYPNVRYTVLYFPPGVTPKTPSSEKLRLGTEFRVKWIQSR